MIACDSDKVSREDVDGDDGEAVLDYPIDYGDDPTGDLPHPP